MNSWSVSHCRISRTAGARVNPFKPTNLSSYVFEAFRDAANKENMTVRVILLFSIIRNDLPY